MGTAQYVFCNAVCDSQIDSKPFKTSKCISKKITTDDNACDNDDTLSDDLALDQLDDETIEYALFVLSNISRTKSVDPDPVAAHHTIQHSHHRIESISSSMDGNEIKNTINKLYTCKSNGVSPNTSTFSLTDRHRPNVYRTNSITQWDDRHIDILSREMSEELVHLVQECTPYYDSEFDEDSGSLSLVHDVEGGSVWSINRIDCERKAMKKQMYHLVMEKIKSS